MNTTTNNEAIANYMQTADYWNECAHCHPEKLYGKLPEDMICPCKCHLPQDTPKIPNIGKSLENYEVPEDTSKEWTERFDTQFTWERNTGAYYEVGIEGEKIKAFISSLLESARSDERKKVVRELEKAIVGCAWVDLEDGNGRYVHVGQLLENIRRNLDLSE